MKKIPFIQVGVGNRGAAILKEILEQNPLGFELAAVVDVVPEYVETASKLHGVEKSNCFTNLNAALAARPDAQAVFIVTPARFHGSLIRESLEANRHVWVEKPLTYDYAEAVALANLAREHKRVVVVGNQYQYAPIERQLQKLISSGTYGRPSFVSYIHHRHRPAMKAFTGELPSLWEQGVHSLDSTLAMLGHPALKSVYALSQKPPYTQYNGETVTNILSSFTNGVQAHLLVTFDSHRSDWEIRVECERAALFVRAQGWTRDKILVLQGEKEIESFGPLPEAEIDPRSKNPHTAFYAAITEGFSAPTAIDTNLKTIEWIDAAVRSSRENRVVNF